MAEESRKEFETKIESLESIVRMFELKAKNAQDHGKLGYHCTTMMAFDADLILVALCYKYMNTITGIY